MSFFYFDQNNQRQGPVSKQQLQNLVTQGVIGPHTPMETDGGHRGVAGQIPSLNFNTAVPPAGNIKQDIGSFVQKAARSFASELESTPPLSRFTFIFLAVFVGITGVHAFYIRRLGLGAIHVACLAPWILLLLCLAVTAFLGSLGIQVTVDWFDFSSQGIQRSGWLAYFFLCVLPIVSSVMALIEIICVTKDGIGRKLERF